MNASKRDQLALQPAMQHGQGVCAAAERVLECLTIYAAPLNFHDTQNDMQEVQKSIQVHFGSGECRRFSSSAKMLIYWLFEDDHWLNLVCGETT